MTIVLYIVLALLLTNNKDIKKNDNQVIDKIKNTTEAVVKEIKDKSKNVDIDKYKDKLTKKYKDITKNTKKSNKNMAAKTSDFKDMDYEYKSENQNVFL
jgi:hypothetical protein